MCDLPLSRNLFRDQATSSGSRTGRDSTEEFMGLLRGFQEIAVKSVRRPANYVAH